MAANKSPFRSRTESGFTLLELLVVLAIVGMLAGLVGPTVLGYLSGAKSDTARLQIQDLGAALDLYYLDVGQHPTTEQGLEALIEAPSGVSRWNGPYLRKRVIPADPWGNEYHYRSPGEHGPFDLYSLGSDNAPGGEGEARDIVSWE